MNGSLGNLAQYLGRKGHADAQSTTERQMRTRVLTVLLSRFPSPGVAFACGEGASLLHCPQEGTACLMDFLQRCSVRALPTRQPLSPERWRGQPGTELFILLHLSEN